MKKQVYITLMEKVLCAYSDIDIKEYTQSVREDGLKEHGYPRLVSNLGILIAHGYRSEYKELFCEMMDLCCDEMVTALARNGIYVGNEFSVKEIVFCILELEKAGVFEKKVTAGWRKKLAEMTPATTYANIAPIPPVRMGNWAAFAAVSEQLLIYAGLSDESEFVDNQIKSQIFSFDENGMYRDPNEPMVYDFVTRLQLAAAIYFGFDGESRAELEENLVKSADITLEMQSVTGEIPYGGRSNQFLHNETFFAALCEFYADLFNKRGDVQRAGMFKSAARIAVENIAPWLEGEEIYHIKNFYDRSSHFGCEEYAYFDKYMVTAGSWLYLAYAMADDSIEEKPCPAETGESVVCVTSDYFHKVICTSGDYCVEFDTAADMHYDANGLGRVHRRGAPSAICMSVPFSRKPTYEISAENPSSLAICAGIKGENGFEYTYDPDSEYTLVSKSADANCASVEFKCTTPSGKILREKCTVSESGVELTVEGDGELEIIMPVFVFDGKTHTEQEISKKNVKVAYKGYCCTYETDGTVVEKNLTYYNRNGEYIAVAVQGEDTINIKIKIESEK